MQQSFMFALGLMLGLVSQLVAAEQTAPQGGSSTSELHATDDFDSAVAQWKKQLVKLRQLRAQYEFAENADQRTKTAAEFEQQVAGSKQLAARLITSAEKAVIANPKNQDATDLLSTYVEDQVQTDNYENAMRAARVLLDHDYQKKEFANYVGLAAFATSDLATARKYLQQAAAENALSDAGRRDLEAIDYYEPLWKDEQRLRAAEAKANDLPRVKLTTSKGDIVLELFEDQAPNTVANFISLVEKHFYDGLKFHRVIGGFMAQGGDPEGTGAGGPGYTIACECYTENHRNHFRGSLSMAHAGQDTGGSQFFLTFAPTKHLDGRHTVFGRVIEGMDVLGKLQRTEPNPSDASPDTIVSATVLRKRNHTYQPVTQAARKR